MVRKKTETNALLDQFDLGAGRQKKEVVYGVYDNSEMTFLVKLNDYLIDRKRVNLRDKSYFFHLLGVMIDAGMSLTDALKTLSNRFENERLCRIVSTLSYNLEKGKSLSDAMEQFPEDFTESEIGIVRSGEAVGKLDFMLARLSTQLERLYNVYMKIRGALVYPITVIIALFVSGGVIILFVLPQLLSFFNQAGANLPFLTRVLLFLSNVITNYWYIFVAFVIGLVVFFNMYRSSVYGRFKLDYMKLSLPLVGELYRHSELVRFISMLGILIESGVNINKALKILSESMRNVLYQEKLSDVLIAVERGDKISTALDDAPLLFPSTVVQMIAVGEKSATLASVCEKISSQYEKELENSIRNMMIILEPVVIVIVGLLVALMAYAILAPVFQMSQFV